MKSILVSQQTVIEPHYYNWLVEFAAEQDILIQDLWIRAINNLLDKRLKWDKRCDIPRYAARSRTDLVSWSVRLPETLIDQVKAATEQDLTSIRTFYYTALIDFINTTKNRKGAPIFRPLRVELGG